ncbi:hypothetical protein JST97_33410 [bacterium]|nr:hypothetical protein [bacterium]
MQRRNFLLAVAWLGLMGLSWAQSTPEQMASWLLGERVEQVPPELLEDLRRAEIDEAAARRVLSRLAPMRAWKWVPFANPPGQPPARRPDWNRAWKPR